jgi:HSP20 family protein
MHLPSPFFARHSLFDLMPSLNMDWEENEPQSMARFSPGYEINEIDGKYRIQVDVPGVKSSDMEVKLVDDNRMLVITGGRKMEKEGSVSEMKFEKRFTIGEDMDIEKITANLQDGVLTLMAPKLEMKEPTVHKISITEGPTEKSENLKIQAKL